MPLIRCPAQPAPRLIDILLGSFAEIIGKAEVVLRGHIAQFCSALPPVYGLREVLGQSPALPVGNPQIEHGRGVSGIRGLTEPRQRFIEILTDAVTSIVNYAHPKLGVTVSLMSVRLPDGNSRCIVAGIVGIRCPFDI